MHQFFCDPICAFADNYIWRLGAPDANEVIVVDPGDAQPVLAALDAASHSLSAILMTHHHQDHIGGVARLRQAYPQAAIIAPVDARIPIATERVNDGARVQIPGLTTFEVLAVPGHTASHVAYLGAGMLFCGDTLFAGGCGRVFDGSCNQLAASLRRLAQLPPTTLCYCAHEYTLANLGFAQWVEPDNPDLAARLAKVRAQRAAQQPSVPSTLAEELATNPFLRTQQPAVIAAAERAAGQSLADPDAVFCALRAWKDRDYD